MLLSIRIRRSKNIKIGWLVELKYVITLHNRDKALLEQIKNLFGVGKFYKHRLTYSQFIVFSIKYLTVIINHFENSL